MTAFLSMAVCRAEALGSPTLKNIVPDAGLDVARRDLARLRHARGAFGDGVGAAGAEDAARGWVDRARDVALQDDALALAVGVGGRLGDDLLDAHGRVERGEGVLEDRLRLAAIKLQRRLRQMGDIPALEENLASGRIDEA